MWLTAKDLAKVAVLARLRIAPNELESFTDQLNSIVECVAQLREVDTTGIEPLAHGSDMSNVFRDDVREPSLNRGKALANSPERNQVGFLIPAVLE